MNSSLLCTQANSASSAGRGVRSNLLSVYSCWAKAADCISQRLSTLVTLLVNTVCHQYGSADRRPCRGSMNTGDVYRSVRSRTDLEIYSHALTQIPLKHVTYEYDESSR